MRLVTALQDFVASLLDDGSMINDCNFVAKTYNL